MHIKLSPRLAAVAGYVPPGATVVDIGTDHAYLPVFLVSKGLTPKVVACDVGRGPYNSAMETVRSAGLEKNIDVRLGDGFSVLAPGEVGTAVIAGMGGKTICRILESGGAVLEKLERLILQPMQDVPLVRRWLLENGWRLVDEEMVEEDKHYYIILVACPGREKVENDIVLELGPRLLEKNGIVFKQYLEKAREEINAVLVEMHNARTSETAGKAVWLKRKLSKIEEVLEKNWPQGQKTW